MLYHNKSAHKSGGVFNWVANGAHITGAASKKAREYFRDGKLQVDMVGGESWCCQHSIAWVGGKADMWGVS